MKKTSSYHHGNLREALLTSAETILRRDGLSALTLRAAAREAGVSHAAPSHHFGDLTGLLTALATDAMDRLTQSIADAIAAPGAARWAGARAYVAFAVDHPALFQLMFRSDRLDTTDTHLKEARMRSFRVLAANRDIPTEQPSMDDLGKAVGGWSLVHGFTLLLLDGQVRSLVSVAPEGTTPDDLFEAMLRATDTGQLGPTRP